MTEPETTSILQTPLKAPMKFSTQLKMESLKRVTPEWRAVFSETEFNKVLTKCFSDVVSDLRDKGVCARHRIQNGIEEYIRPEPQFILNAFAYSTPQDIKLVILGEDPYPQKSVSDGLAFSKNGPVANSSLYNIFRSLHKQGLLNEVPESIDSLKEYATQGVLLLNSYLTRTPEIVKGTSGNIYIGSNGSGKSDNQHTFWLSFTQRVIEHLIDLHKNDILCIFAMGNAGKQLLERYEETDNLRLYWWSHPSPASTLNNKITDPKHFINCPHFTNINNDLVMADKTPVNWNVNLSSSKMRAKTEYIFLATDGAYHKTSDTTNEAAAGAAVFSQMFRDKKTCLNGIYSKKLLPHLYDYTLETFELTALTNTECHVSNQRAELLGAILGLNVILRYITYNPGLLVDNLVIIMVIDNTTAINYINHGVMRDYSDSPNRDLLDILHCILTALNKAYGYNVIEEYRRIDIDPQNRPRYNIKWSGLTVVHQYSHTSGNALTGVYKEIYELNNLVDKEANDCIKRLQ